MACNTSYATAFPARDFAATNSLSANRLTAKSITGCEATVNLLSSREVDLLSAGSVNTIQLQAPPQLAVSTQYTFPAVDGAPGDVLSTDGAGSMVWTGGSTSGSACQCFDSNSATPFQIKNATNITKVIEFDAAAITPGTNRVFVAPDTNGILPGQPTFQSVVTGNVSYPLTGGFNAFYGADAGITTTSGVGNAAFGFQPLRNNTTGNYNTAVGLSALLQNINGDENTGIGNNALSQLNTGIQNTSIGTNSLVQVQNGSYNAGVGAEAGSNLLTGSNNTFLGRNTQPASNGENNSVVIGTDAISNGSNTVAIGDTNVETQICLLSGPLVMDREVQIKIGANIYRLHATIL